MTCPDWRRLVTAREREGGEDPPGWQEALEHLEACPQCRRTALEAEPLLVLRRLPEPVLEPDEGRRMVAATRALRRRQTAATRWRRRAAAAVAVVTVGAALTVGSGVLERGKGTRNAEQPSRAERAHAPAATEAVVRAQGAEHPGSMTERIAGVQGVDPQGATSSSAPTPSLVDLEQPTARVYEVTDAALALVVVVDSELELGDRG